MLDARLDVEAWHVERVFVPAGHAYAIRYDGVIEGEWKFSAWISDDPSRIPLSFRFDSEWGLIDAELVGYAGEPPGEQVLPGRQLPP